MGEITRCKVRCSRTAQTVSYTDTVVHEAEFHAAYDGSKENESFFKWTPTLMLGLINQPFEVGKEYYLDFIPVDGDE